MGLLDGSGGGFLDDVRCILHGCAELCAGDIWRQCIAGGGWTWACVCSESVAKVDLRLGGLDLGLDLDLDFMVGLGDLGFLLGLRFAEPVQARPRLHPVGAVGITAHTGQRYNFP